MPSDWRWVAFPLAPGKSWDMKFHESRPADRQTEEIERRCVAEAEEAVTVPAGTFPTVRVRCTNARNDAWLVTIWYSPQVTHLVREDARSPAASGCASCSATGYARRRRCRP
jgi:hypothetical protein